jgi:O-antigen/teichoic acid export membrane protein
LASLKQLAGQTVWYGVSNIGARLLTSLLTPYFTYTLTSAQGQVAFGQNGFLYTIIPLMNVLYTYGMETAFFRYSNTEDNKKLYNTQVTSMLLSTAFFTALLWIFRVPVADFATLGTHTEYVGWCAAIIGLDALSALPYAKLRKENRPRKYAFTKVAGIVVYVVSIVFFFSWGDDIAKANPNGSFAAWYNHHWGIGLMLFANVLQSAVTLLLLSKELADYRPQVDRVLLKRILIYGFPILITGFAGVINDTLNRVMFQKLYPSTETESLRQLGFYSAAVKLAVLINLAIQAFKMAAEPYFFSIAKESGAQKTYARVMKWFVILLALMFLNIALFMDIWKLYVGEYTQALDVVPVLLLSYVFLGIYYNLTVWYKLTDKTRYGMYIMLIGAAFTIVFNFALIPTYGYYACAWGMLICNGLMMWLSYYWGQKHYPIPYATGKLLSYLGIMLLLYLVQYGISMFTDSFILRFVTGVGLFSFFLRLIAKREREELKTFPILGKYIR